MIAFSIDGNDEQAKAAKKVKGIWKICKKDTNDPDDLKENFCILNHLSIPLDCQPASHLFLPEINLNIR